VTDRDPSRTIDPERVTRILRPLARDPGRLVVTVEDATGHAIGMRPPDALASEPRLMRDLMLDGAFLGRLVAVGRAATEPSVADAIEAVAVAIEQLADAERRGPRAPTVGARAAARSGLAAELAVSRAQQRSIVSLLAPDVAGYDLASHYEPAREVGGDFFELFRLRKRGRPLGVVIADVTGKGIAAALLMAFARPVIHAALDAAPDAAEALQRTNRILVDELHTALFITALAGRLELSTGQLRMANAGHEPPLLVPGDGRPISPIEGSGPLLGAFAPLSLTETATQLDPGDRLVLYTDGVTDSLGPTHERFGKQRLIQTLEANRGGTAHDLVAAIRDAVAAFRQSVEPADDVTIVAVGRQLEG
jgi:Stage II sporulation protein E (SpoIIE)